MAAGYVIAADIRREALEALCDGESCRAIARRLGVARTTVQCWADPTARKRRAELKRIRKWEAESVPVAELRSAVEASSVPMRAICILLDWPGSETTKLARYLGIRPWESGRVAERISEDLALKIMRAIHADPFEVGL